MECVACHSTATSAERAAFPAVAKCAACHREMAKSLKPFSARLYKVADFVFFSGLKTDKLHGQGIGNFLVFEKGVVSNDKFYAGGKGQGEPLAKVESKEPKGDPWSNWMLAIRSRKHTDLNADILEGHYSSALGHIANISYRLGGEQELNGKTFRNSEAANEALERMKEHLAANGVQPAGLKYRVGPLLKFDASTEKFVGEDAAGFDHDDRVELEALRERHRHDGDLTVEALAGRPPERDACCVEERLDLDDHGVGGDHADVAGPDHVELAAHRVDDARAELLDVDRLDDGQVAGVADRRRGGQPRRGERQHPGGQVHDRARHAVAGGQLGAPWRTTLGQVREHRLPVGE